MSRKSMNDLRNSARCQHRTPAGRQCRAKTSGANSDFCEHHAAMLPPEPPADFAEALVRDACRFQNAKGINYSLGALYTLLAQDRISPRRAAVLAYISCLLMRSLTAIDNDRDPREGMPPRPGNRLREPVPSFPTFSPSPVSVQDDAPASGSSSASGLRPKPDDTVNEDPEFVDLDPSLNDETPAPAPKPN